MQNPVCFTMFFKPVDVDPILFYKDFESGVPGVQNPLYFTGLLSVGVHNPL